MITALIGGPLILIITYLGGIPFLITSLIWAILSVLEFCALGNDRHMPGNIYVGVPGSVLLLLAVVNHQPLWALAVVVAVVVLTFIWEALRGTSENRLQRVGLTLAALLYSALPAAFIVLIRALPDGLLWMVMILMFTWGTDSFAYLGGRLWGKHLLAPTISPKKTVEGAAVGVRANVVLPGTIATDANLDGSDSASHPDWVRPSDLAAVIRYLASDAARTLSGAAIPV